MVLRIRAVAVYLYFNSLNREFVTIIYRYENKSYPRSNQLNNLIEYNTVYDCDFYK